MSEEILNFIEIHKDGKSYKGIEIFENKLIYGLFKSNRMNIPYGFYERVKSENGIISLVFENGHITRDLKNVSNELYQEFLSEYNRGFSQ